MADNKLSWTELRRALANRAGVTEKEANAFLSAFNAQLIEALKKDKQVKINGLGMFRLQTVAARKSVNVASGEQITIGEYNKIAFVPEAGVKELMEKGEVRSETSSAAKNETDPIKKLGAQAEEIVDILGELGQSPEEKEVQPVAEPEPVVAPEPEPVAAPEPEPVVVPEPEPVVAPEPKVVEPEPVAVPQPEPEPEVKVAPKKEYHFVRDTLICVVILLMLLFVGYFFLRNEISGWIESLMQKPEQEIVIEEPVIEEPEVVVVEEEWTFDELLLTENIAEGSRLAWISRKYYGHPDYWPYLYDANRDRIDNPSNVPVGTQIRVPKLTKAQRDMTSSEYLRLKEEAVAAIR